MKNQLENKIALITGGGQGLGAAICESLAQAGAHVLIADIREDNAKKVADSLVKNQLKAEGIKLDVSDAKNMREVIEYAQKKCKSIDIVINNAAIDVTKPIEELSIEEIDRVIQVNLRGTYIMSKLALEIMYKQGQGQLINIASTASLRAWTETTAYHATKWGIRGLTHALYAEARRHNIKVSCVIPGGMRTPFILERFPDTPLDKLQDPKNVAEVVQFVLTQPQESIIPEVMITPLQEGSWP